VCLPHSDAFLNRFIVREKRSMQGTLRVTSVIHSFIVRFIWMIIMRNDNMNECIEQSLQ
jgi:hypothetical protein